MTDKIPVSAVVTKQLHPDLLEALWAEADSLSALCDCHGIPNKLQQAITEPLPTRPNAIAKFKVMASYAINAVRLCGHRGLPRRLGFSNRGWNALLAAFSSCHLFRLSLRQMIDTGLLPIMTKAYLTILDLGDDILDEYVAEKMSAAQAVDLARDMFNQPTLAGKTAAFLRRTDAYLSDSDRRAIASEFFEGDLAGITDRLADAFDFSRQLDDCRTLESLRISAGTRAAMEDALAFLFDVCIYAYTLERTTMGCMATPDQVINIYRAKSAYYQHAYMSVIESLIQDAGPYQKSFPYIQRLKRVGVHMTEQAMFGDDLNDVAEDILKGQPNLIVSIASSLEHSEEFAALLRLAIQGETFSHVLLRRLTPLTHQHFMNLKNEERRMLGLRSKPLFSWFLAVCINFTDIGWRESLRHHFGWFNRQPLRFLRGGAETSRDENVRLAWLVSSREPILDRLQRFGVALSAGGAEVLTLMVQRRIIPTEAVSVIARYIAEAQGDEQSRRNWQRVMQELTSRCDG